MTTHMGDDGVTTHMGEDGVTTHMGDDGVTNKYTADVNDTLPMSSTSTSRAEEEVRGWQDWGGGRGGGGVCVWGVWQDWGGGKGWGGGGSGRTGEEVRGWQDRGGGKGVAGLGRR